MKTKFNAFLPNFILVSFLFFSKLVWSQSLIAESNIRRINAIGFYKEPQINFQIHNTVDLSRWKKAKTAGIVMTGIGTAISASGIIILLNNNNKTKEPNPHNSGEARPLGLGLSIGGGALIVGGITTWLIARKRIKQLNSFGLFSNGSDIGIAYKLN